MDWRKAIARAAQEPGLAWSILRMLAYGYYIKMRCQVLRKQVRIGRQFMVEGSLEIRGPGSVVFGDNCTVVGSARAPVTPYTHAPEAEIVFGNRVVVNGTRFGCRQRIEIGEGCLLADARIMDTDFHALDPQGKHRWQTIGESKPIVLGPNVWVCAGAMVLKGVTIGANSVIAAGAVVSRDVPPNVVVAGNPAQVVKQLGSSG